jgi:hypothetical protein
VTHESLERVARGPFERRLVAEVDHHSTHERGDVLEPAAEGGELDAELGDAKEEVAPERPLVDLADEVTPRRGDDAHVDGLVGVRADALYALLGERAEKLRLDVDGELAELVEEDGAAVGLDERRDPPVDGPGEAPTLMTKEGALGEGCRNGAAIDDDERFVRAGACLVDGLRDELLAGARLARDENTVRIPALFPTSGPNSAASGTDTCSGVVGANSRRVSPQSSRVGLRR